MGERCEVQLDKPYYYPGDTINGLLICYFNSENKVRDIRIRFKGEAKVSWKVGKSTYTNEEHYFEMESNLLSSETTFQSGNYSYPFVFNLPLDLPSSVNDGYRGNIKYQVKVTIDRPWAIDYVAKKNFFVYNYLNLNRMLSLKDSAVFIEEQPLIFGSSEAIKVVIQLPKTGYVPGEMIFFTCSVRNNCRLQVKEVIFNFVQGYELISRSNRTLKVLILDGQTYGITDGTVPSNSERTWNLEMRVPNYVYNGSIKNCKVMRAFWELRGVVRLPLFFPNLEISVPLTIGSVPFVTEQQTNIAGDDD